MLFFTGRVVTKRFIFPYGLFRENAFGVALRLRSNESPSGSFKQASDLRWQMEGLCPDKRRGRDKREIKKIFSLIHGQSKTEAIPIVKPENQRFSNAVSLSMRR